LFDKKLFGDGAFNENWIFPKHKMSKRISELYDVLCTDSK